MKANSTTKPVRKCDLVEILAETTVFQTIMPSTRRVFIVTKHVQQGVRGHLSLLLLVIQVEVQNVPKDSFHQLTPVGHPKRHLHIQVGEMTKDISQSINFHWFAPRDPE